MAGASCRSTSGCWGCPTSSNHSRHVVVDDTESAVIVVSIPNPGELVGASSRRRTSTGHRRAAGLSIVLPCFNEVGNLADMVHDALVAADRRERPRGGGDRGRRLDRRHGRAGGQAGRGRVARAPRDAPGQPGLRRGGPHRHRALLGCRTSCSPTPICSSTSPSSAASCPSSRAPTRWWATGCAATTRSAAASPPPAWNRLVRTLYGLPFKDVDCAFKLFPRDLATGARADVERRAVQHGAAGPGMRDRRDRGRGRSAPLPAPVGEAERRQPARGRARVSRAGTPSSLPPSGGGQSTALMELATLRRPRLRRLPAVRLPATLDRIALARQRGRRWLWSSSRRTSALAVSLPAARTTSTTPPCGAWPLVAQLLLWGVRPVGSPGGRQAAGRPLAPGGEREAVRVQRQVAGAAGGSRGNARGAAALRRRPAPLRRRRGGLRRGRARRACRCRWWPPAATPSTR